MRFFLGTHMPAWLARTDVPLFISRRRLAGRKRMPRARGLWALDSGGFTELNATGRWETPPAQYVAEVRRFRDEIGGLQWAAVQDWMCEPFVLEKTRLTVEEHQRRTIASYLELRELGPDLPWCPVVQGWARGDYDRHLDDYARAGIDLQALPVVGVGSVCRRQNTTTGALIVRSVASRGIRVHGFGFKITGLLSCSDALASADSLAWSYHERREKSGRGNSLEAALEWQSALLARLETRARQDALPGMGREATLIAEIEQLRATVAHLKAKLGIAERDRDMHADWRRRAEAKALRLEEGKRRMGRIAASYRARLRMSTPDRDGAEQ